MSGASIKWRLSNRSGETGPQAAGLTGHCNIERLEVICLAATFRKRVRDNLRQTRHHTLVPHHYAPPSLVDHRQPGIPSLLLPRENFRPLFHRLRLFQLSIALPFLPPSSLTPSPSSDASFCSRRRSSSLPSKGLRFQPVFMHRGLTQASEHAAARIPSPTSPSSSAQHGLDRPRPDALDDVHAADGRAPLEPQHDVPASVRDASSSAATPGAAIVDAQKLEEKLRRLSRLASSSQSGSNSGISTTAPTPPSSTSLSDKKTNLTAGQRITEYERALTPGSAQRRDKVVFQIVKRPGTAAAQRMSLDDFPNGLLSPCFICVLYSTSC